jgi:hypothetical protein
VVTLAATTTHVARQTVAVKQTTPRTFQCAMYIVELTSLNCNVRCVGNLDLCGTMVLCIYNPVRSGFEYNWFVEFN